MRVIAEKSLEAAGLQPHEQFFVELWYSMTHLNSLDSYRVKCLNAHAIIRELNEELRIGLLNDAELQAICGEVMEILRDDSVIHKHFATQSRVLQPLLEKPPKSAKSQKSVSPPWKHLKFVTQDFLVALDSEYLDRLCSALPAAVKPGNEDAISRLVGALLSELVAQNWPLESLYRWHQHFLKPVGQRTYTFEQDLAFMLRQFQREPQLFRVTLRLSGSKRAAEIGAFHDFRLTDTFTIAETEKRRIKSGSPEKFLRSPQQVVFATTSLKALDEASAAIQARTAVEELLDIVRFDYESQVVKVDRRCLVLREGDGRVVLLEVQHTVPNPRLTCEIGDFKALAKQVDLVLAKSSIDAVSLQQLRTGIRQYRFGRDAEGYRDKFVAWWMGLEALTNLGQIGSIGSRVALNASRAMLCGDLHLLLREVLETLRYLDIAWPADLAVFTGCAGLDALTVAKLLLVLQSNQHANKLWGQCTAHPVLIYRGKQLQEFLSDPRKMHAKLEEHRCHLEWHLCRLYRIRCCIVHGTPICLNLALYAANLEFYLKEIIRFVLTALNNNDHIVTLDELFHRAASRYDRVKAMLADGNAKADAVHEAVFMDVVVRQTLS